MQLPRLHIFVSIKIITIVLVALLVSPTTSHGQTSTFIEFERSKDVQERASLSYDLFHYYIRRDIDSIKILGVQLMLTEGIEKNAYAKAMARRILGSYQIRNGEQQQGVGLLKQAVRYFERKEDYLSVAEIYTDIGNGFFLMDELDEAKRAYETSMDLGQYSSDPTSEFTGLLGLGRVSLRLGDTTEALNCYRSYREKSLDLKKFEAAADASALLGELLINMGNHQKGVELLHETRALSARSRSKIHMSHAYTNLGIYYFNVGKIDSSEYCFKRALRIRQELNNTKPIIEAYFNLGDFYSGIDRPVQAELHYLESIDLAEKNNLIQDQIDAYDALISLYENDAKTERIRLFTLKRDSLERITEERKNTDQKLIRLAMSSMKKSGVAAGLERSNTWFLIFLIMVIGGAVSYYLLRKLG